MARWKLVEKHENSSGFIDVHSRTYEISNGEKVTIDILEESDGVSVLALTDKNEIVLITQFRPGPDELVLEMPGGVVDKGESPIDAAIRELREETGYVGDKVEYAGSFIPYIMSPATRHFVIIDNCQKVDDGHLDPTEDIEVCVLDVKLFTRTMAPLYRAPDAGALWTGLFKRGYIEPV